MTKPTEEFNPKDEREEEQVQEQALHSDSEAQEEKTSTLSEVLDAIHEHDDEAVSEVLEELKPAEVARTLESLPPSEREQLWEAIPEDEQGEILAHLGGDVLDDLIEDMSTEELSHAVEDLDSDDLVDLLHDMPEEKALSLLQNFDSEQREKLLTLLEYDDDTAGGMMNTDSLTVRPDTLVKTVVRYLRMLEKIPDATTKLFVVDRNAVLLGEVHLSRLIVADDEQAIADMMKTDFKTIPVETDSHVVAQIFREYDLVAAAVINENGQLLGRITVDDVLDFMQDESEKMLLNSAGLDEEADTLSGRPLKKWWRWRHSVHWWQAWGASLDRSR